MQIKSVSLRLMVLVVLSALAMVTLSVIGALMLRQSMLDDKIALTRNVAQVARDTAKAFYERSRAGEFDEATAQNMAKTAIRGMHYAGAEYLFVYQWDGLCLVHGGRPEREGVNHMPTPDGKGDAYIAELLNAGKTSAGGHVFYNAPKAGSSVPIRKVSSVVGFEPWRWAVGTGVYLDDVEAEYENILIRFALYTLVLLCVLCAGTYHVWHSIAPPLKRLAAITAKFGHGHYDQEVPATNRSDEIGVLAQAVLAFQGQAKETEHLRREQEALKAKAEEQRLRSMHDMADTFENHSGLVVRNAHGAATDLQKVANVMGNLVEETSRCVGNVDHATARSSSSVATVASATEELSASINEISQQVQRSAQVAQEAVDKASVSSQSIGELANVVGQIGEVAQLIEGIASQTNLLALNATIEAARAGEAGKGFAVVANEVKHLATQTANATSDIAARIAAVQAETQTVSASIDEIVKTIHSLREISGAVAAAVEQQDAATREIAQSVQEAATGTFEVTENVRTLMGLTENTNQSTKQLLVSTHIMAGLSDELDGQVKEFVNHIRQPGTS